MAEVTFDDRCGMVNEEVNPESIIDNFFEEL